MSLTVGQKLWYVPNNYGRKPSGGCEVEVVKIGRKWATIKGFSWREDRINLETLALDGGDFGSPGRCYLSQAEFLLEEERQRVWREFYRRLTHSAPTSATIEQIMSVAEAWGVKIPEEEI